MDRFGSDLQKIFEQNHKIFPQKFVFQLGLRLVSFCLYLENNNFGDMFSLHLVIFATRYSCHMVAGEEYEFQIPDLCHCFSELHD